MVSRDKSFKQAAWTYLIYGLFYLAGATYLASRGLGASAIRGGPGVGWFIIGGLFLVIIPLLLYRPWKFRGLFAKILTILVALRAFAVGRVMLHPTVPTVPLPGGGEISMSLGAALFFLITLITFVMLARAAWILQSADK